MVESTPDFTIHYINQLVHNDAKKMLQELEMAVSSAPHSQISLLVGRECFCEMNISDFASRINAKVIDEKNCIEAVLGPERTQELQKDKTTIHTRGWMKMIHQVSDDDPISRDSIRQMLGYFEKLVLLDYGIQPYTDEEILSYYDLLEVPIEIESAQLDHFEGVLNKLLKPE